MHTATRTPGKGFALREKGSGLGAGLRWGLVLALEVLLCAPSAFAQIAIEGVEDREVLADQAICRVVAAPGDTYDCRLNGLLIPPNEWIEVNAPDYYELVVRRRSLATGLEETRSVQFIVRASERGNTEWGLPAWTPHPVIDSAPGELADARLRVVVPRVYPVGLEIPIVSWLEDADGRPVRGNGLLTAPGYPSLQLRRGVGSGFLPPAREAGPLQYAPRLAGLEAAVTMTVEEATSWTAVSGTVSGSVTWPENSRIAVTGSLTLPADATLQIGAGTIVRLEPGVDIHLNGRLEIRGNIEAPVVFAARSPAEPWGGFIAEGSSAQLDATGAFFVRSGANAAWFDQNSGYDVHRKEQALFLLDGARATLTDCWAFDGRGQFGHGKNAFLNLTRSLAQRFITGGEYTGGSVQIERSALIEFPQDDDTFADADNDGIYFTTGRHVIRDSLIGWAKDDGVDAGSGGAGSVLTSNVWVEGCFHEAFAWSGGDRVITNLHCVTLNSGQGIEAGWSSTANSPSVFADDCLSVGNLVGARFGDNYDWTYNGLLRLTNSLLLFNHHDVWGMNWDDWTYRSAQMDLRGNRLSVASAHHPENVAWQGNEDGPRLAAFLTTRPDRPVGLAFALRHLVTDFDALTNGVPVGLSTFATNVVSVAFTYETGSGPLAQGTLQFEPGETVRRLPGLATWPASATLVRARLSRPHHAEFTGATEVFFVRDQPEVTLIRTGSSWRYLDTGVEPPVGWATLGFDDRTWKEGRAELGYGDADERTTIDGGPAGSRIATTYFRHLFTVTAPDAYASLRINLRRDDGGIAYLNGDAVFRSNMPTGVVDHTTYTGVNTTSETAFFSTNVVASALRSGANVVAVEIHQADRDSSDVSFEFELVGATIPRLQAERFGDTMVLCWAHPGFGLETADSIEGPWLAAPTEQNYFVASPGGSRFYRLRQKRALRVDGIEATTWFLN